MTTRDAVQIRAVEWANRTLAELHEQGRMPSVVVQAPTGFGKSRMGELLEPDLWIAPGDDLVRQTQERTSARCVTTQLLARHLRDGKSLPRARRAVLDEGRWTVAAQWSEVPRRLLEQGTELVILDATPCTAQGQGLGSVASSLYQAISVRECIARGYLVPFVMFGPAEELDAMAAPRGARIDAATAPVAWHLAYQEAGWIGPAARSIWFCESQAHAGAVAEAFTRAGIPAEQICDRTPRVRRMELLGSRASPGLLARGELRVLTCPEILRQGIDIPEVEVIGLARRVGSFPLRQQAVGRGARLCPSIGKERCLVFDLYGTAHRPDMGLPDRDMMWSLDGAACRPLEPLPSAVCCRECLGWWPGGGACPMCGAEPHPPRPPRVRAADLVEVRAQEAPEIKAERLLAYVADAYAKARRANKPAIEAERSAWAGVYKWQAVHGSKVPRLLALQTIREVAAAHERGPAQQSLALPSE